MRDPLPQRFVEGLRGRWSVLVPLLSIMGVASGCAVNERFAHTQDEVAQQINLARYQQAVRCAPQDLAIAEANAQFASLEFDQAHFFRAEEHLGVAKSAAARAVKRSVTCAPDTDGDGITDRLDKCPKVAGPKENHGCPWPDTDKDGLTDNIDKCPTVPGPKENHGCPWGDADKDGIPDNIDKCPHDPEDKDGFQDADGCPDLDNDKDGVPDVVDRCPFEKGPVTNQGCPPMDTDGDGVTDDVDKCPTIPGPPEFHGCPPPDRDGDGVPDYIDKCPDEPGLITNQGCPNKYKLVVLRTDRIEIQQQVHFATNRYRILKDSYALLKEVAQVLKDNPNLRIHIDGHTDSVADDAFNMRLSQKRAEAVRKFLIKAGIAANRLVAQGFGETMPIASNMTAEGRAKNRRVEFNIIKRKGQTGP